MMFLRALFALFAYDVVCKSCSFEAIYVMVKHWSISHKNGDEQNAVDRVCNAVNYACIWYPKQVLCHSGCVRDQRTDQTGWPIGGESACPVAQCGKTDPLCEVSIRDGSTVVHDGRTVRHVEPVMQRVPWTICPGAAAQLQRTFTGVAIADFAARGEKRENCTHLHDLAIWAAAHAFDGEPLV